MIKAANELKQTLTIRQIIEYLEDYIMEKIEEENNNGRHEICISAYSISANGKTGELKHGLASSSDKDWQWYNVYTSSIQEEVLNDFTRAGYKVFQRPGQISYFVRW